jgi:hypothetical protein
MTRKDDDDESKSPRVAVEESTTALSHAQAGSCAP